MMVNKFAALALCLVTMLQIEVGAKPVQGENVSITEKSNPLKVTNYKIETTPVPWVQLASINKEVVKREAKDDADLETAAGTNILRPLFVYRQQVEYRRRIKKNNNRGT